MIILKHLSYKRACIISALIAVLIGTLSLSPLQTLPEVPGTDKLHHLIAYLALALPTSLARVKSIKMLAPLYVMYGGIIELIQPYVNRYGEILDFGMNTVGIVIASIIGIAVNIKVAKPTP